jgi:hypothetical protein
MLVCRAVGAKANVLQSIGFVRLVAALLILRRVGILSVVLMFVCCRLCRLLGLQPTHLNHLKTFALLTNSGRLEQVFTSRVLNACLSTTLTASSKNPPAVLLFFDPIIILFFLFPQKQLYISTSKLVNI